MSVSVQKVGNCAFESLLRSRNHPAQLSDVLELRRLTANYFRANRYKYFKRARLYYMESRATDHDMMCRTDADTDEVATLDEPHNLLYREFCDRVEQNGNFAGEIVLICLSDMLELNVTLWRSCDGGISRCPFSRFGSPHSEEVSVA